MFKKMNKVYHSYVLEMRSYVFETVVAHRMLQLIVTSVATNVVAPRIVTSVATNVTKSQ